MLQFENPAAFLFLIVLPLFFILRKTKILKHISFPITLSDWNGNTFNYNEKSFTFAKNFARILMLLAYCALVTALASPIISKQQKVFTSKGTEIIFVVDVSPSMAAKDMGNLNRLEYAKQKIESLVQEMRGTSFGLVSVASEAATIVPPTLDHEYFLSRLRDLQIGDMGEGTAIGTGISTAAFHLTTSKSPKKCLVLLTDGENNAGAIHPMTAAKIAKDNDITIYTVGIGTRGSVLIEYTDSKTGKRYSGYLDSQFDEELLQTIASMCSGIYFTAENSASITSALKSIKERENVLQTFYYKNSKQKYYDKVLWFAAIDMLVAWIIRRLYLKEIF